MGWTLQGSNLGRGKTFLLQNVQTSSGTHTVSYSIGTGVRSQAVKRQGHEVDHLSATSG